MVLISTKEGSSLAPSSAADQVAINLGDEVSAVEDEVGIDPEDSFYRCLNLLIRIIFAAQTAR